MKQSSPTQTPPHSGVASREMTMAGAGPPEGWPSSADQEVAISLETACFEAVVLCPPLSAKAEGAMAVAAF